MGTGTDVGSEMGKLQGAIWETLQILRVPRLPVAVQIAGAYSTHVQLRFDADPQTGSPAGYLSTDAGTHLTPAEAAQLEALPQDRSSLSGSGRLYRGLQVTEGPEGSYLIAIPAPGGLIPIRTVRIVLDPAIVLTLAPVYHADEDADGGEDEDAEESAEEDEDGEEGLNPLGQD